ncbi:MAG: NADH-quinone oxidoreductase subunit NuoB [Candidatus Nitrosopolaris sp.]
MVKFWILYGIKNGILTTKYPARAPTSDEIPVSSIPPSSSTETSWVDGEMICPTGAIQAEPRRSIDLGKCIYCKRCASAGFVFDDKDKSEMGRKIALQAKKISAVELAETDIIEDWNKKRAIFKRSFHIMMIDVGSCNACNLEVLNMSNPYYDLTRLGIFFTNSPKHADALVVVGALNTAMVEILKRTYESMPNPKVVISVGTCAISGGIFHDTEGFVSPIQDIIPVDVTVPGCPPTPIQILEGLLLTIGKEKISVATRLEDDNKFFQQR